MTLRRNEPGYVAAVIGVRETFTLVGADGAAESGGTA